MKKLTLIAMILLSLLAASCSKDMIEPKRTEDIEQEFTTETYFLNLTWTLTEASYENDNNGYTWTLKGVPINLKSGYKPVNSLRIYKMTNPEFYSYSKGNVVPATNVYNLFKSHL